MATVLKIAARAVKKIKIQKTKDVLGMHNHLIIDGVGLIESHTLNGL